MLSMLKKENGVLSIARVATLVVWVIWCAITLLSYLQGKTFPHYDTMSAVMLCLFFVVLCSKTVDSKLLSIKIGGDQN